MEPVLSAAAILSSPEAQIAEQRAQAAFRPCGATLTK